MSHAVARGTEWDVCGCLCQIRAKDDHGFARRGGGVAWTGRIGAGWGLGRATRGAEGTLDLWFPYAFWAAVRIADRPGPDRAGQPVIYRGPLINRDTDKPLLGGDVVRGLSR